MSILIKGMEMPTRCGECKAFVCYRQYAGDSGDCFCGITKSDAEVGARNADCPLVPVPPHGRLIDADAVEKQIDYVANLDWNKKVGASGGMLAALEIVEDALTIIEAEGGE